MVDFMPLTAPIHSAGMVDSFCTATGCINRNSGQQQQSTGIAVVIAAARSDDPDHVT